MLQDQKTTQAQLHAVRGLRTQLLDACQVLGEELEAVCIRTIFDEEEQEAIVYSSDEEEQQLSSEEIREQQELLKEVSIEAGLWIIAPEAKAVQVLFKAGKLLKLGKQIKKGGQILIKVADSKVDKEATQLVQKMGGRVVEKGITSLIKRSGLPSSGKIRFIPRPSDVKSGKILTQSGGYVDKFGNVWKKPKGIMQGENVHWDVQLSSVGKKQLGHLSKNRPHLNVTGQGDIHH